MRLILVLGISDCSFFFLSLECDGNITFSNAGKVLVVSLAFVGTGHLHMSLRVWLCFI